jgi:putative ABC transport system permease protein
VAASYALVVGFVGAVLGALVGFIPGVAITYPLTSMPSGTCVGTGNGPMGCETGPYLDVPWLLIAGVFLGAGACFYSSYGRLRADQKRADVARKRR